MQQNALLKVQLLNDEIKSWHQSMRPLEKIYTNLEGKNYYRSIYLNFDVSDQGDEFVNMHYQKNTF